MKKTVLLLTAIAAAGFLAACGAESKPPSSANKPTNSSAAVKPPTAVDEKSAPPLATGHDSGAAKPPAPAGAPSADEKSLVPAELQDKVTKAEAKAKAANATPADKVAAAKAFIERGNIFYEAGQPRLYKYALRDFRIAARFDPSNAEASGKRDQIIQIYQSMNRPVPTDGEAP
jgi:hypothetical protein